MSGVRVSPGGPDKKTPAGEGFFCVAATLSVGVPEFESVQCRDQRGAAKAHLSEGELSATTLLQGY